MNWMNWSAAFLRMQQAGFPMIVAGWAFLILFIVCRREVEVFADLAKGFLFGGLSLWLMGWIGAAFVPPQRGGRS